MMMKRRLRLPADGNRSDEGPWPRHHRAPAGALLDGPGGADRCPATIVEGTPASNGRPAMLDVPMLPVSTVGLRWRRDTLTDTSAGAGMSDAISLSAPIVSRPRGLH